MAAPIPVRPLLWGLREVMAATGLGRDAAYALMHRAGAVRIGCRLRVRPQDLEAYLAQLAAEANWGSPATVSLTVTNSAGDRGRPAGVPPPARAGPGWSGPAPRPRSARAANTPLPTKGGGCDQGVRM
jgi:hypothetical protein